MAGELCQGGEDGGGGGGISIPPRTDGNSKNLVCGEERVDVRATHTGLCSGDDGQDSNGGRENRRPILKKGAGNVIGVADMRMTPSGG